LKDHPPWIRNTRIRRRVELPDIIVRQPEVNGRDVVFELLSFSGCDDDHAADTWRMVFSSSLSPQQPLSSDEIIRRPM
jgi:hypothetical protein